MTETLMKLTEELDGKCTHFLSTYTRKSKLRVAKKAIKPVLRALCQILTLRNAHAVDTAALKAVHPFDIEVLEIAHFPARLGKGAQITRKVACPRGLINIGVYEDGRLVSQLTTPNAPFWVAGSSRFVTLRDLATVGVSAYDLVEQAQCLAHRIFMGATNTQQGAAA